MNYNEIDIKTAEDLHKFLSTIPKIHRENLILVVEKEGYDNAVTIESEIEASTETESGLEGALYIYGPE